MCPDLSPTDVISLGADLKDRGAQKIESKTKEEEIL